VQKRKIFL